MDLDIPAVKVEAYFEVKGRCHAALLNVYL